jgi:hypothetical protein
VAYRLALQWGIEDVKAWLGELPHGVLDQWIAWDSVEPMGEAWKQTASLIQAINLPLYARADKEMPSVSDFMPTRYRRPRKRLTDQLFGNAGLAKKMAGQVKAMFGFNKGVK